jgi:hypothetical protein
MEGLTMVAGRRIGKRGRGRFLKLFLDRLPHKAWRQNVSALCVGAYRSRRSQLVEMNGELNYACRLSSDNKQLLFKCQNLHTL